ncbi:MULTISPECIES: AI-2E family transporter [Lachnospiraceae]|uniref:AI-2E family transporter n=1 Tax=Faecalicatena acetigenes TaxID=2981790 RepID=A0ABT2TAN2_9FIRM|nr:MULTISPECIES: AI-2E family transporter [Lachnospiraceae]MCU6746937.1 AI-2E family transporter [Faecalicatena acetigenes]SCH52065.1 pheromone autoinducer 2 transporter [uncultured Clostridium sp.]
MKLDKETIKKLRGLIVFTIVILILLWKYEAVLEWIGYLFGIVFPFFLGGAIAFILNVPMSFLEEKIFRNKRWKENKHVKRMARPVSMVLTILLVFGIIVLVMFVVVPELGKTFLSLGTSISEFVPRAQKWLEELFVDNKEVLAWLEELNMDWDKIINSIVGFFRSSAGNVVNSTVSAATGIINGVATFVIAFVFACYILLQKEKLSIQIRKVMFAYLPQSRVEWMLDICSLTYRTFSSFLTGQCLEALILGVMFFVVMTIIQMPYALLVGVLIAFTALIPIFGAFIGCFIGTFLILMVDPLQALIFVIMFLVLQQIEGNLIYPKVVGSSVGLPSIWVLAAVSIGGSLLGVVGMLIFIPLVSVVYSLLRRDVYKRLDKKQIKI